MEAITFIHTEYFTKENINDQILRLLTVTLVGMLEYTPDSMECSFNMSLEMLLFLPLQRSVSLNSTLAFKKKEKTKETLIIGISGR